MRPPITSAEISSIAFICGSSTFATSRRSCVTTPPSTAFIFCE